MHSRQRSQCKECGGGSICEHHRVRSRCKECGGGGICKHNRRRTQCKECQAAKKKRRAPTECEAPGPSKSPRMALPDGTALEPITEVVVDGFIIKEAKSQL